MAFKKEQEEELTEVKVLLPKKVYTPQNVLHHYMPTGNVCFKGWNNIDYFCMPLKEDNFDFIIDVLKRSIEKSKIKPEEPNKEDFA